MERTAGDFHLPEERRSGNRDHGLKTPCAGTASRPSRVQLGVRRGGKVLGEFEMHYRADRQILVLSFLDNQDTALPILQGQEFEAIGPSADDRFTVVKVKGQEFLVFASDLKRCATVVPDVQRSAITNPKVAA